MKKALIILIAAVVAATAGCFAGCSKGQTGGGNNTVSNYTRTTDDTVTDGGETPEEQIPCPDCGKEHRKGHKNPKKLMPPEGAAWLKRRKPAPIPPAPETPEEPEAPEDGGQTTLTEDGTDGKDTQKKAPDARRNKKPPFERGNMNRPTMNAG